MTFDELDGEMPGGAPPALGPDDHDGTDGGIGPGPDGGTTATGPALPSVPEWACDVCGQDDAGRWRFVGKSATGLRRHRNLTHGPRPAGAPGETSDPATGDGGAPAGPRETMPGVPARRRRTLRELVGRRVRDAEATPRTRRTWPSGKREPLDEAFTWLYGSVGTMIVRSGTDMVPVGRVMEMQAPSVGVKADEAIAGTLADRVLQPFVKQGKAWREVGEMVGLPVMTGMIVRRPELLGLKMIEVEGVERIVADGPLFQPYYSLWEQNAVAMAKGFERTEVKRRDTLAELRKVPFLRAEIDAGNDPIIYMMLQVLGYPQAPQDAATPAAAAGDGAAPAA